MSTSSIKPRAYLSLSRAVAGVGGLSSFHFNHDGIGYPADSASANADPAKVMREEFSRLHDEASAVLNKASGENRDLTAEEKSGNDRRFTRMQQIKNVQDENTRFAKLAVDAATAGLPHAGTLASSIDPPGRAAYEASEGRGSTFHAGEGNDPLVALSVAQRAEFKRALSGWANTGNMDRRFATITTATSGGILLPKAVIEPEVVTADNAFREAMALAGGRPVQTAGTGDLTLPVLDADAGGVVAENANAETENEPDVGGIRLTPKTFQSGSAWFSNQQLAAVDFDLAGYIGSELVYAKELGLESAIAASIIADAAITQVVTTATTTGLSYVNLVDLNRKLPKRYDRQKAIVLNSVAYAAVEKLVGSDGHPVLVKDPQNEQLLRFNGTPVVRSDYFEAFGATKVVGCLVSFLGFKLRDVTQQNLARYTQVPSRPNQTGFNLFSYHAWGYTAAAVAKLRTPAA